MPSEFNHIDEFFRQKEEEAAPDVRAQEQHWKAMQQTLNSASAPVRPLWRKVGWAAAALLLITGTVVWFSQNKEQDPDTSTGHAVKRAPKKPTREQQQTQTFTGQPDPMPASRATAWRQSYGHYDPDKMRITADLSRLSWGTRADTPNAPASLPDAQAVYNQFFQALAKPAQKFRVRTDRDTTIYGREGSVLHLPAGIFETSAGAVVTEEVEVRLQEFFSMADIVSARLSTASNGQAIVTAGMIHVEAQAGPEPLRIRRGAVMNLKIPAPKFDPRMQLFMGDTTTGRLRGALGSRKANEDSTRSGEKSLPGINWLPSGQQQMFFNERMKRVKVLNLQDHPYETFVRHPFNPSKSQNVARFRIVWNCPRSTTEIRNMLMERYGKYYDDVVVRREWKPLSAKRRRREAAQTKTFLHDESVTIGDSVMMPLGEARKLNLISVEDSLAYESKWKQQLETAIQQNAAWQQWQQQTEAYQFRIQALGWINCDRFANYPPALLTDLRLQTDLQPVEGQYHTILLFKRENVIIPGYLTGSEFQFHRIPTGEEVVAISIGVREGKVVTAFQELRIEKGKQFSLRFSESTPEAFRQQLARYGTVGNRG